MRTVNRAFQVALVVAAVAAGAAVARGQSSAPPAFHLVFDGKHNANLLHEGPFTTTSSFCPSGYAADVTINDVTLTALRKFTCSDSGADFTARIAPLSAEHGGSGTWQIVDGTGPLAELRGKGIWTSERLSGGPDPGSITFRSTWDGVADFDTDSPEIAISKPTARKLPRPAGSYALHMTLGLTDAAGTVSYLVLVYDARRPLDPIGSKTGQSRTTSISATLRVRPKKRARTLRIHVDATDPYGNHSALTRSIHLR